MEYKVSGMNWLCVRAAATAAWIPVFPLTAEQAHELKQVEKWLDRRYQDQPIKSATSLTSQAQSGQ